MQVQTQVGPLDVREAGPTDGPPVLLLHGFPQGADCWDAVVPLLTAAGYRTVAPDQRGYSPGARPAGRRSYTSSAIVADAVAVIEQRCGGRAHVVGHDWGAAVAWRLAARHPDRVRTLAALSVPPPAVYVRAALTSRQALASWYVAALQVPRLPEWFLGAGSAPWSRRLAGALRSTGQTRERAVRDARRLADPAALSAAIDWYRGAAAERPVVDPPVPVPVLFVWSDGDTAITRQAVERTPDAVRGPYRYAELRGVSHWIPEEAPDQLAELLLEHFPATP